MDKRRLLNEEGGGHGASYKRMDSSLTSSLRLYLPHPPPSCLLGGVSGPSCAPTKHTHTQPAMRVQDPVRLVGKPCTTRQRVDCLLPRRMLGVLLLFPGTPLVVLWVFFFLGWGVSVEEGEGKER